MARGGYFHSQVAGVGGHSDAGRLRAHAPARDVPALRGRVAVRALAAAAGAGPGARRGSGRAEDKVVRASVGRAGGVRVRARYLLVFFFLPSVGLTVRWVPPDPETY